MVKVTNRGRRAVNVDHASYVAHPVRGIHAVSNDLMQQLADRPRLEESQSITLVHGQLGGYRHGQLPTKRWYVQDGAGRIHPLRERYRLRVERVLYAPIRLVYRLMNRRARGGDGEPDDEVVPFD